MFCQKLYAFISTKLKLVRGAFEVGPTLPLALDFYLFSQVLRRGMTWQITRHYLTLDLITDIMAASIDGSNKKYDLTKFKLNYGK
jgi:hypothetical protein